MRTVIYLKKATARIILIVLTISLLLLSFCGCSSSGFKEDDFEISLKSVSVDGNVLSVTVEFRNKSWHSGKAISGGETFNLASIIHVECKEINDDIPIVYPSIAINHWIMCKQKVTKKVQLQLEKGTYRVRAICGFLCNNNDDSFFFSTEEVIIEI
ncbi:MAG: hypothetical protein K2K85_08160 [Clostridia bacterium]|nr:hypothetical protein [Clostridia bacterium]